MRPPNKYRSYVIFLVTVLLLAQFLGLSMTLPAAGATDHAEIERRLRLAPFAYVAEVEYDYEALQRQGYFDYYGYLAYIDSYTDSLANRPEGGSSLQAVAVSPNGKYVYVTDHYEPVLHVFDAESQQKISAIELPNVEEKSPFLADEMIKFGVRSGDGIPYSLFFEGCASDVACTPDGSLVLVCSSGGLQVINAETNQVIKTLEEIKSGILSVSFDGSRAFIIYNNFSELPERTYAEWFEMIMTSNDYRLIVLDLQTWQITGEINTYAAGGIAVRPDQPELFFTESYKQRVRVIDANTLEDLWQVSTEPSYGLGIGFMPDGSKAYAVCSAEVDMLSILNEGSIPETPSPEDFFCAVINTAQKKVVKKIPLDAF